MSEQKIMREMEKRDREERQSMMKIQNGRERGREHLKEGEREQGREIVCNLTATT